MMTSPRASPVTGRRTMTNADGADAGDGRATPQGQLCGYGAAADVYHPEAHSGSGVCEHLQSQLTLQAV